MQLSFKYLHQKAGLIDSQLINCFFGKKFFPLLMSEDPVQFVFVLSITVIVLKVPVNGTQECS